MKHERLKEIAYTEIRQKILNAEFQPGTRIREDRLAEEIAMSRTPVREAIHQLTAEGLLKQVPRRGVYLNDFTHEEILDLIDVRQALESLAVIRCIQHLTDDRLAKLKVFIDDYAQGIQENDNHKCNQADLAFHREIANQSNNTILQQHLAAIEVKIHIARISDRFNDPIRKNKATLKEHALILQAITDRDKTAAVITVRNNITHMKQHFERDVAPLMTEVMGTNHTN